MCEKFSNMNRWPNFLTSDWTTIFMLCWIFDKHFNLPAKIASNDKMISKLCYISCKLRKMEITSGSPDPDDSCMEVIDRCPCNILRLSHSIEYLRNINLTRCSYNGYQKPREVDWADRTLLLFTIWCLRKLTPTPNNCYQWSWFLYIIQ